MNIEVGDYIIGSEIFLVEAVNNWSGHKSYDLLQLTAIESKGSDRFDEINEATRGYIRHLGRLVKKNDSKALRILFG